MIYYYEGAMEFNVIKNKNITIQPVERYTRYTKVDLIKHEVVTFVLDDETGDITFGARGPIVRINDYPAVGGLEPDVHLEAHHLDSVTYQGKEGVQSFKVQLSKYKPCSMETFLRAMKVI